MSFWVGPITKTTTTTKAKKEEGTGVSRGENISSSMRPREKPEAWAASSAIWRSLPKRKKTNNGGFLEDLVDRPVLIRGESTSSSSRDDPLELWGKLFLCKESKTWFAFPSTFHRLVVPPERGVTRTLTRWDSLRKQPIGVGEAIGFNRI